MTFYQNTDRLDLKNRRMRAMFGAQEVGSRWSDPEYLRRIAPPPLESEESKGVSDH